jgi:hypothetical protein
VLPWKNFLVKDTTTEVLNRRPRVERHAKIGLNKLLTSIPELLRNIQRLVFLLTSAETQMDTRLFGAILLIQRRDGKNVFQEHLAHQ